LIRPVAKSNRFDVLPGRKNQESRNRSDSDEYPDDSSQRRPVGLSIDGSILNLRMNVSTHW
jgi:hypothetical protein